MSRGANEKGREFKMSTGIQLNKEAFDKVEHLSTTSGMSRSRVIQLIIEAVTEDQLAEYLINKLSKKE